MGNIFDCTPDDKLITDELLSNSAAYKVLFDKGSLPLPPAEKVAIVACMDARLNVYGLLGLKEGDAHLIRNAGGIISEGELRSLGKHNDYMILDECEHNLNVQEC